MKLTGKIIVIYMLAMALMTAVFGASIVRREDQRLKQEVEKQARSMGVAMQRELIVAWQDRGHEGVGQMISRADSHHGKMSIRWIARNVTARNGVVATSVDQLETIDRGRVLTILSSDSQRIYYPIDTAEQRAGYLEFSQPLSEIDQYTRGTIYQTSSLLLGLLACGGLVTLVGVRLVGQPLQQLIAKTKRIGEGDFSKPLQIRGHDELSQLGIALNSMSEKLAEQQRRIQSESTARVAAVEQLRHVDRLNTVGRLASGVAHELGTPLNVVSGRADLITSGQLDQQQCRESALAIKSEADRMSNIIRQLLDFARRRSPQRTSVNLRDIADQCAQLLQALAKTNNVVINVTGTDSLSASVDAVQIQQVVTNLIVNAVQAMPHGGTVTINLSECVARRPGAVDEDAQSYCCISVADEGVGIDPENRDHLFEPFFTTKDVGEGTGLGLSVSYGIVQDHDGWIDVDSEPGKGSRFTVYLKSH